MSNKRVLAVGAIATALVVPTSAVAMAASAPSSADTNSVIDTRGGGGHGSGQGSPLGEEPAGILNADLEAHLIYLAEEEKVAHDLYVLAYAKWGIGTFSNISGAETRHFNIIDKTLDLYGLPSETDMGKPGVFDNKELQAAYDKLAKRIKASKSEAVAVGVLAEMTDIADLKAGLAMNPPSDVKQVLSNLVAASKKHLAAFQKQAANLSNSEITVKASAVKNRSKIRVNVNPNQKYVNYKVKVQKKVDGKWKTKKVRWTKGTKDVRTINMGKGKYRIKVPAQHGMDKEISNVVRLRR